MSKWSKRSTTPPPSDSRRKRRRFRFDSPPKYNADITSENLPSALIANKKGPVTPQESPLFKIAKEKHGATQEEIDRCREIYVTNYPASLSPSQLIEFLDVALQALNANIYPGSSIIGNLQTKDKKNIFLIFRSIEEANNCLALDGINCLNQHLRIGRPKSFPERLLTIDEILKPSINVPPAANLNISSMINGQNTGSSSQSAPNNLVGFSGVSTFNSSSASVNPMTGASLYNTPEALFIRGLPSPEILNFNEVSTLLETFGPVQKMLHIRLDQGGNNYNSKITDVSMTDTLSSTKDTSSEQVEESVAICTYVNAADCATCRDYLSGWSWGTIPRGTRLQVLNSRDIWNRINDITSLFEHLDDKDRNREINMHPSTKEIPSRCIWIPSILTYEECLSDDRYFELMEDVEDEFKLFADVWNVKIPRPTSKLLYNEFMLRNPKHAHPKHTEVDEYGLPMEKMPFEWTDSGTGDVFVEFANVQEAIKIMNLFYKRTYNKRPIYMHYFNEGLMMEGHFNNPTPLYDKRGSSLYNKALQQLQQQRQNEIQENLELEREEETELQKEKEKFVEAECDRRKQLEAEAELMAAEEVARKKDIMTYALMEIGNIIPTNVDENEGELLRDDESSMKLSDDE